METRKKIGFKNYEEEEVSKNTPANVENNEAPQGISVPMSPAQAELVETINGLAEIIVSKEFAQFADKQRVSFVMQLMNSVALNTEITTKTMLLIT